MTKLKILIIDDEINILRILKRIVERMGYEVITTSDPRKCLGLVKEHKPSVVLTDYAMPIMNGLQVIRSVIRFGLGVQLVLMSGELESGRADAAYLAGAIDCIHKPVDRRNLLDILGRACEIANRGLMTIST